MATSITFSSVNKTVIKNNFSVLSYNMHGYNQGCTFLENVCGNNSYDAIFIQEHWLSPAALDKILKFNDNYIGFGISAMESAVAKGILKGRPYGGTAILLKKCYANHCTNIFTHERVVSVSLFDFVLINVYLPCEDGSLTAVDCVHELLTNISMLIENVASEFLIFGGDFIDIKSKSSHAVALNEFLLTYKLLSWQHAKSPEQCR